MFSSKCFPAFAVIILGLGLVARAQEAATPPTDQTMQTERMGRRERRGYEKFGRHGEVALMRGLELSEAQRQQQRAIFQLHLESIKGPREELFKLREKRIAGTFTPEDEARAKSLRMEIRHAMHSSRSDVEAILTTEQRAKLEQLKSERKARYKEMRQRREDRGQDVPR